jgi:hypothetical protein
MKWSYEDCEPYAEISYGANLIDRNADWVRLSNAVNGTPMNDRIRLVTTQLTYAGRRWWPPCAMGREDDGPPRRVGKLYLPSGGKYFGNRQAYGLTYASCQKSRKNDSLLRRLAPAL